MTVGNNQLVISDFDGTITIQDVNDALFAKFGDQENQLIEKRYQEGLIGHREALEQHYSRLKMSREDFENFVADNIAIDPCFSEFYSFITGNNLAFAIMSGGFINYIKLIFNREKIEMNYPVYANEIVFSNGVQKLKFYHNLTDCSLDLKTCGNCKHKVLQSLKRKYNEIIYIGDGWTDRCAARLADRLLVKKDSSLESYCRSENLNFDCFLSFHEVLFWLKEFWDQ